MVRNFFAGGAAINALARAIHARVIVVDMGTFKPVTPDDSRLILRRIAAGTANLATGPAMTPAQALPAIEAGMEIAETLAARRVGVICAGEIGIGNTTAASAIIAAVTGQSVAAVTGRGTGLDDAGLARKLAVIEQSLRLNHPDVANPLDVLAKLGGFEIGGLVGLILGAAQRQRVILLDGLISTAAALLAVRLSPEVRGYLIAGHRSVEPGHGVSSTRSAWSLCSIWAYDLARDRGRPSPFRSSEPRPGRSPRWRRSRRRPCRDGPNLAPERSSTSAGAAQPVDVVPAILT